MLQPRFHHFEVVDSTNDLALDLARRGEPEGTIVTAGRQISGKGRLGRTWWDEPGQSVLMSVIVAATPETAPQLAFVASLAAAECLGRVCDFEVEVRWPNDLLVGGRKIGGILVETAPEISKAVIGLGINVNQIGFPSELANTATSVAISCGTCLHVDDLTIELCHSLFGVYEEWIAQGFEEILSRWHNYMWGLGRQFEIESQGETVTGRIRGVDPTGALLLEVDDGSEKAVVAADSIRLVSS